MSTVYNQYVVTDVFVGPTGHSHKRSGDKKNPEAPTAIDCVECEPFLVKEGWVYDKDLVPLTDRQIRDQERATREGTQAVRWAAEALAGSAKDAVANANKRAAVAEEDDEPQQIVVMTAPREEPAPTPEPVKAAPEVKERRKPGPKSKAERAAEAAAAGKA